MAWYPVSYFVALLITFFLMGYTAEYSRRRQSIPGAYAFKWLSCLICLLCLFEALAMIGPTKAWAMVWFNLRFISLAGAPVFWLVFVMQYTGYAHVISLPRLAAMLIIPAVTQVMIWSNTFHGLWVMQPVDFYRIGSFFMAVTAARIPGIWMWIHLSYSYILILTGIVILLIMSIRPDRQHRRPVVAVGAGMFIIAVGSLLPTLNLVAGSEFNPLTLSMAAGSFVMALGMFRYKLFREMPMAVQEKHMPIFLVLLFVMMIAGIAAMGYFYYYEYENRYRTEIERQLWSIADLKIHELVTWRKERLGDAAVLHGNESFAELAGRLVDNPADAQAQRRMQKWMEQIRSAYQYKNVILLDASGRLLQSAMTGAHLVCPEIKSHIPGIRQTHRPAFLDLHREADDRTITMSVLVPVADRQRFLGVVALIIDPDAYLYPMIKRWPTSSRTAETLLIRREGNDVVFLNELRFQKNTALALRFPLNRADLPAARAVRGDHGVIEGIDYRGVPVIAATRAVPDSPWFMIARMDKAEIYAPTRERYWLIIFLVCSLSMGTWGGVWIIWQRQNRDYFRQQIKTADALRESEEKFRKAFMTSPDAVAIIRWRDGRIVSVNPGFLQITGMAPEEVEHKTMAELPLWENPDDRVRLAKKFKTDAVINEEARFRKKNGLVFFGLISGSVLDLNGERHLLSITRDITDRKLAEAAIMKLNEDLDRRVAERTAELTAKTAELERINQFFVDRELRMRELKAKIAALEGKAGTAEQDL